MTSGRPDPRQPAAVPTIAVGDGPETGPTAAGPDAPPGETAPLTAGEVRGRSVRGVVAVIARGLGVRTVGLVVSIVLARLLAPSDFGVLAFGTTLVVIGSFLTDAGLAAQLIRTPETPTRRQLSAVLGAQLLVTVLIVGVASAVLLQGSRTEQVTAIMLWSLLPSTFRVPAIVQLERDLRFKPVAFAEVLETVVYAVLAIGTVALGAGVWGVAAATVLRPFASALVLQRAAPQRVLRPRLDWAAVAPLLAFGLTFQVGYVLVLIRDQGINLATAALSGTAVLGYWSLSQRVMLVPFLLFESVWRVSYPAVARLLAVGHDVRNDLARSLVLGAVLTGIVVVPLSVSAPVLVTAVFGDEWQPIVPVVPLAAAGLALSGPLSAVAAGYLTATGRVRIVALAQGCTLVPWAVLLPLLISRYGVTAHGIAWLAACLVDALVLGWALQRFARVPVLRSVGPPVLLAVLVGAAGLALVAEQDPGVLAGCAVAALSAVVYAGISVLVAPAALRDLRRLSGRLRTTADTAA